jgi:hypothetical protein
MPNPSAPAVLIKSRLVQESKNFHDASGIKPPMIGMTVYYSAKEYSGNRRMSPLLWKIEIGKWKLESRNWKIENGKSKLENKVASFQILISSFQFLDLLGAGT